MNRDQVAMFKFTYPDTKQAPDALTARAIYDASLMFLEPHKFDFLAVYDTYPDEDDGPEPGTVDILVTAQYREKTRLFRRRKTSIYN